MLPIQSVFDTSLASDDKEKVGRSRGGPLLLVPAPYGTFVGPASMHGLLFAARVMSYCMKNLQVPKVLVLGRTALLLNGMPMCQ